MNYSIGDFMIRISIASDLHLNHYEPEDVKIIVDKLVEASENTDITIIAGDAYDSLEYSEVLEALRVSLFGKLKNNVYYVLGNHDFWDCHVKNVIHNAFAGIYPAILLNNRLTHVGPGLKLYGGTMWFPELTKMESWKARWADFVYIKDSQLIFEQHEEFKKNLLAAGEVDIVVSHHLPSFKSVTPMYATAASNMFFVSNQEDLIEAAKPKLWVHGHSHSPMDYMIGKTRIINNALGYPRERGSLNGWYPKIVEL